MTTTATTWAPLFSSADETWATPPDFFAALDDEFHFGLDVCARAASTKVPSAWYGPDHPDVLRRDAFERPWLADSGGQAIWMNPPYGRAIVAWMRRAYEESLTGATVVCLVPARTDTRWFHDWVQGKAELRFVKGRLKFGGAATGAPFPSLVVIYRPPA